MGKVTDLAQELRNHAVDNHTRGCGGRSYSCECGYDSKTEHLLRAAARSASADRREWLAGSFRAIARFRSVSTEEHHRLISTSRLDAARIVAELGRMGEGHDFALLCVESPANPDATCHRGCVARLAGRRTRPRRSRMGP
jgi:hypothetical protein